LVGTSCRHPTQAKRGWQLAGKTHPRGQASISAPGSGTMGRETPTCQRLAWPSGFWASCLQHGPMSCLCLLPVQQVVQWSNGSCRASWLQGVPIIGPSKTLVWEGVGTNDKMGKGLCWCHTVRGGKESRNPPPQTPKPHICSCPRHSTSAGITVKD
jgi:hypothetical protein